MKKILAVIAVFAMIFSFSACGKKADENKKSDEKIQYNLVQADEELTEDEQKIADSISYEIKDSKACITVKTSSVLWLENAWLGVCPAAEYKNEEQADAADVYYQYMDAAQDKNEWFDGVYHFNLALNEFPDGTYAMVLCDNDDGGKVVGQWGFSKDKSGSCSLSFKGARFDGAGESRKELEFDTPQKQIESWFGFDFSDGYLTIIFSGFLLDENKSHWAGICPEGEYKTFEEADRVDVSNSPLALKCPYIFALEADSIENGKYTMVLCENEGKVLVQFGVEKTDDGFKYDFTKAKSSMTTE